MREQKKYEVSITDRIEDLHEGSGVLKSIKRKVLMHREAVIAESQQAARVKAINRVTKKATDVEDVVDRLEVEVSECTFRG